MTHNHTAQLEQQVQGLHCSVLRYAEGEFVGVVDFWGEDALAEANAARSEWHRPGYNAVIVNCRLYALCNECPYQTDCMTLPF